MIPRRRRLPSLARVGWWLWGLVAACGPSGLAAAPDDGWVEVDYAAVVDERPPTHSGESVGTLLARLGGRALPAGAERGADRAIHGLLEPLLEPYAFVLPDAYESLVGAHDPPMVEIGALWLPGEPQPAWAELLRARRLLVESDGAGRLRVFAPWAAPGESLRPTAVEAARAAWDAAWPVLRHVLAAERRRLSAGGESAPPLAVVVHAYRHAMERSTFELGLEGHEVTVGDTRAGGQRPPLDLAAWRAFLAEGLVIEGGRIEPTGDVRLFGAQARGAEAELLSRPLDLSDFAVAYRAVWHGGLAEPYMSLDRGFAPQTSIVSYGGRLNDTALGWVSLLCDIRFKTFSLGVDILSGEDRREELRRSLPQFRTHLERLAADPASAGLAGQQTRLWFYPDEVDLTLSATGDVAVLRRVRMSGASERLVAASMLGAGGEDPPWTRATIEAIDRDYDALATFFPELRDLDQVVRLLAFFTWLRHADRSGHLLPELDALLALELPAYPTPRTFPQLLAFNALPEPGSTRPVEVFDRVPLVESLDRLEPAAGPQLAAARRLVRARSRLDSADPQHADLLRELQSLDLARLGPSELDLLTYRALRLGMHHRVLATLERPLAERVVARQRAGERMRMFSVGIGGLDLGMEQVLTRSRSGQSPGETASATPGGLDGPAPPRESWRADPPGLPETRIPPHGLGRPIAAGATRTDFGQHWVAVDRAPEGSGARHVIQTVTGADGPEARSRRLFLDGSRRPIRVERFEAQRRMAYHVERDGVRARLVADEVKPASAAPPPAAATPLPDGLALLEVLAPSTPDATVIPLRLSGFDGQDRRVLEASIPRSGMTRLLLGRGADFTPTQPLPAFEPLPSALGSVTTLMVLPAAERSLAPWDAAGTVSPGEEDPLGVARALGEWWRSAGDGTVRSVVGWDPGRSPERWRSAPAPGGQALLLLPEDGFPPTSGDLRRRLIETWHGGPVADRLTAGIQAALVVVVSAEGPARFAARLRELSSDPALEGKLLAAWCVSGPIRADLAASLLDRGKLAGLGLAEGTVVGLRDLASLEEFARGLAAGEARPERLGGPFLWHF